MRSKLTEALNPTPERMRHGDIREVPTDRAGVVAHFASEQDALDRYYRRGELADRPYENARRYDAGARLRDAWQTSGLASQVTGSYQSGVDHYRDPDIAMVRGLDASREYARLIRLVGPVFSACVIMCCCFGEPVGPRANMEKLRIGLARLADALGLD